MITDVYVQSFFAPHVWSFLFNTYFGMLFFNYIGELSPHLAPSSPFLFVCEAISITRVLFMEQISAPKNLISYHPQTSKTNIQACRWRNL